MDRAQRWVWIDDAHGYDDHAYLTREGFDAANFRLLPTDERIGLTWVDVQRDRLVARPGPGGRRLRRDR